MASSDSTGRTLRKRGDSMTLKLLIVLLALLLACSNPTEPQEPEPAEMSIDSLLGVIDTLTIQFGHNRCLVRCLQATLDSLNITPHCRCGI